MTNPDKGNVIKVVFGKKKPVEEPLAVEVEVEMTDVVEIDCVVEDPVVRNNCMLENWPGVKYLDGFMLAMPLRGIKI